MALEKQVLTFPLTEGIDTKTDPKLVSMPKLLTLENARRDKAGRISKRYGHEALGSSIAAVDGGGSIENADALGTYDDELLIFSDQSIYSYSDNAGVSGYRGGCVSARASVKDIIRNDYEQNQVDSAALGDISIFAYEDTRWSGIFVHIVDTSTGAVLLRDTRASTSGTRPRCVAFGSNLFVFYADGGTLYGLKFNPTDPVLPSPVSVSASLNIANPAYDILVHDTFILAGFNVQGAAQTRLHKLNDSLSVVSTVNIAEDSLILTLVRGFNSYTFVVYHNASGVRAAIHDVFLAVVAAPFLVENIANVENLTGYALPFFAGVRVFYHISAAATYNHYIKTNKIYNGGTIDTPAVFLRSVGLASKAWLNSSHFTDQGFVCVCHESPLQNTFFIARSDGRIVGKLQPGTAGARITRPGFLSSVFEAGDGQFRFAVVSRRQIGAEDGKFQTLRGVSLATIDFSDSRNYSTAELAGNCLITGGIVQVYDSAGAVEQGFHLFPENITFTGNVGGSLTLLGTYSYQVCYEWTDNRGQVHRSAPSVAEQITLTGANNRVTLVVPCLRLTSRYGTIDAASPRRGDVKIVVYRTENNGDVYYQASSSTSPTYNSYGTDSVSINDDLSDADLISRPPLYTTAGSLENIAPPTASLIAVYRNRVFLGGTEDDTIWFSKQVRPNRPIEFNDAFTIKADPVGGELTAMAALDDKLILFKENSIFMTGGDGPEDNGQGGIFFPPELVTADAGCIDSKSVVSTPLGLMFKSRKGYYLLNRNLESSYVGAEIEEFNSYAVSSSVLMADSNEVRFTTQDGPTLVYNYFFKQWIVWPSFLADDSIIWQNKFVAILQRVGNTSLVVQQVEGLWADLGQKYSLKIGLSWASMAQVQGFQRVWRAIFLGDYRSPHTLKLSVGYNFSPVISDEYYWNPVSALNIAEYGDGAFYGTEPVYGGSTENYGVYQIRTHLVQQKSQAVRFILEDQAISGSGEGFSLSSVAFEIGLKKGIMKLQAAQTQ